MMKVYMFNLDDKYNMLMYIDVDSMLSLRVL